MTFKGFSIFFLILTFFSINIFASTKKCEVGVKTKKTKRIVWFAGSHVTGFWPMVEKIMQASAKDLGVILEVYHISDPIKYINNVQKVLNREKNPIDGVLFHNHKHRGEELLKKVEEKGIPAMLFNAGFDSSVKIGKPREKYSCWIASMLPDDEKAGFKLATALFNEAKKHKNMLHENRIEMVALEGDRASNVSTLRMKGMRKAIQSWEKDKKNPKILLHQSYHSKWRRNLANIAFKLTQSRYPKVSVYWTAADVMALGIIDASKELGKISGKDFVTGGMDLLPSTFKYLEEGSISASVGAHFVEGTFALIALYDYLNGYDFAKVDKTQFLTNMALGVGKQKSSLTKNENLLQNRLDKIDFSKYSNAHNQILKPYDFNTQDILDKLW